MFFKKFFIKKVRSHKKLWFNYTEKKRKGAQLYVAARLIDEINVYIDIERELRSKPDKLAETLQAHYWSKEFRLWLLEQNVFALVKDANSQAEIALILEKNVPVEDTVAALQKVTPSKETAEKFFTSVSNDSAARICKVMMEAYKVFFFSKASFEAWLYPSSDQRYAVVLEVAKKALTCYAYWTKNLIEWAFKENNRVTADFAHRLVLMARTHQIILPTTCLAVIKESYPDTYKLVRNGITEFNEAEKLILQALDMLEFEKLQANSEQKEENDSLIWLTHACNMLKSKQVREKLMQIIPSLDKVNKSLSYQVNKGLSQAVEGENEVITALKYLDKDFQVPMIWRNAAWGACKRCFPFTGWSEEYQKQAIHIMAFNHELSAEQLNRLKNKMREYAVCEMETVAEIDTVLRCSVKDLAKITAEKLPERVEKVFLEVIHGKGRKYNSTAEIDYVAKIGNDYLEKFALSTQNFAVILQFSDAEKRVQDYAQKHNLTQEQYELLLSDKQLNWLAPLVKDKVKKG